MIRYALISDSHNNIHKLDQIICKIRKVPCDAAIFLGDVAGDGQYLEENLDIPVYAVHGNNDWAPIHPSELLHSVEQHKLFITHGDHYGVRLGIQRLAKHAITCDADIALYGHTHIPNVAWYESVLCINPGSAYNGNYGILEFRANGPVPLLKRL